MLEKVTDIEALAIYVKELHEEIKELFKENEILHQQMKHQDEVIDLLIRRINNLSKRLEEYRSKK